MQVRDLRHAGRPVLAVALFAALASSAGAAGNGAGAGGAGAQRAINSGLPPGEPGPPGAANNRHPRFLKPAGIPAAPRPETATGP